MKNEGLPTKEELEEYKIKIREKAGNHDRNAVDIWGWPQAPAEGLSATDLLRWRIVRFLVGATTRSGRKVKGYGLFFLFAMAILGIMIYGESSNPFFLYSIITYIGIFIVAYPVIYTIYLAPRYMAMIKSVRQGEKIPVAVEKTESKGYDIKYVIADTSYTEVIRIPVDALDNLFAFGIEEERGRNNQITWRIKWSHHNFVLGAAAYSDLDPARLDVWGTEITVLPADMDKALAKMRASLKRSNFSTEDEDIIATKIREIYAASELISDNEKEIFEMAGNRFVKIKVPKSYRAFFSAWQTTVPDVESYHRQRMEQKDAIKTDAEQYMGMINNARMLTFEYMYAQAGIHQRIKEERDNASLAIEKLYTPPDTLAVEQSTASRAPDIRESEDVLRKALDKKLDKDLQEWMDDNL